MYGAARMKIGSTLLVLLLLAGAPAFAQSPYRVSVYFDWNDIDLTPSGREIVNEAVRAAKACNVPDVKIVGHDDTSLSSQKAQELSNQRADAVRAAMINGGGIDPGLISSEGRGDLELNMPTADGVREPFNRRVQIDVVCR